MSPQDASLWLGVALGVSALAEVLRRALRRAWRTLSLAVRAVETIQRELTPNGGGSTHDLVRKLKAQADVHESRLDSIDATTSQAAEVAGLATSRAERAAELAHDAVAEAKAARMALAESDARRGLEIARTQGAVESLERTLALTVISAKPAREAS